MNAFSEISIILVIAAGLAVVMQSLRLPLILGYIITGILAGPAVFHLVQSPESLSVFSQLGITVLLFLVGLNLSPRVLRDVGKAAIVTGLGQIAVLFSLGYWIARAFDFGAIECVYIGLSVTFASTIIALKFLSDKKDLEQLYGKIAAGILLVQDLFATLVLLSLSSWNGSSVSRGAVIGTLANVVTLAAGLYVVNRFVLARLTKYFASSQEFLFLFSLGWGLGVATLFRFVGLSLEVGALTAGVILASSPYHFEISAKMRLLRDFFITLFFVFLGYQAHVSLATFFTWPVAIFSLLIVCVSPLVIFILLTRLGYAKKTAFFSGITLSQMSEFAFLLLMLGLRNGHISQEVAGMMTMVGLVSIVVSSLMIMQAERLYALFTPVLAWFERRTIIAEKHTCKPHDVLLFGCHRLGQDFLPSLIKQERRYLVVDFNPDVIARLHQQKIPCRYGDAEDNEFLDELCLPKVKMIISTIPDVEANLFILHKARKADRDMIVVAVAQNMEEAMMLYRDGASYVIMPHYLGGNYATLMLDRFGFDGERFREEGARHVVHLQHRGAKVLSRVFGRRSYQK
ncbi:MAG: cation:proton antiporter [Patescibacteria group bacterium]